MAAKSTYLPAYLRGPGECVCTRSVNGGPTRVSLAAKVCMDCDSDAQCAATIGPGAVCVMPDGRACGFTVDSFCVPAGCPIQAGGKNLWTRSVE